VLAGDVAKAGICDELLGRSARARGSKRSYHDSAAVRIGWRLDVRAAVAPIASLADTLAATSPANAPTTSSTSTFSSFSFAASVNSDLSLGGIK
jgi:hypothetical protein